MISVVVPIFNTSKYLEQCVSSLFSQSISDIEYIFVDDASTDNSLDVLMKCLEQNPSRAKQSSLIRHSENKGLPQTRADGIAIAKGDYIIHCDSDDWVKSSMYQEMYDVAQKGNFDIVSCGFVMTDGNTERNSNFSLPKDKIDYLSMLFSGKIHGALCNKLIRRALYDHYVVPKGAMLEDLTVFVQLLLKASSWISLPYYYYYYRNNLTSITNQKSLDSALIRYNDCYNNVSDIISFIDMCGYGGTLKDEIIRLKHYVKLNLWDYIDNEDVYQLWKQTFPEVNLSYLGVKGVSLRFKVIHLLALVGIYPFYKKICK